MSLTGQTRRKLSERGQAIILFVGLFSVILVMAAIVVDFGLWFAERRSAQRVADLAAAAAAIDLPADDTLAEATALEWAARNDHAGGVEVTLLCANTISAPGLCTNTNDPSDGPSPCSPGQGCDTVRVVVARPAPRLFTALPFIDVGAFDIEAGAVAGVTFGGPSGTPGGPDQTIILLDANIWMRVSCGRDPTGCPMAKAREAALGLVNLLLPPGAGNLVGYAPYHNCYGPRHPIGPPVGCVADVDPGNLVIPPVSSLDVDTLTVAIQATSYYTSKANICVPLSKARELFPTKARELFPSTEGRRTLVLLSDGDNLDHATDQEHEEPPPECHPSSHLQLGITGDCDQSRPAERQLDYLTWQLGEELKADGVEIFVVGTRMCPANGTDDGGTQSQSYCNGIGDGAHDNIADQRLLKCIASSPDHYKRVDVADIPNAFTNVAVELAARSLLQ